jgi:uncharacterized membrane protein
MSLKLEKRRRWSMEEQNQQQSQPQEAPVATETKNSDVENNKALAIVGYIVPILFFIPLLTEANTSPFAKFHSNQQLLLLLACIAVQIVGMMIPIIGWFLILPFGSLALIVIAIIGIINAAKGEMKKLPLIGGFELIK